MHQLAVFGSRGEPARLPVLRVNLARLQCELVGPLVVRDVFAMLKDHGRVEVIGGDRGPTGIENLLHARAAFCIAWEELAQLTQLSPRKDLKFVAEDLVRLTSDVDEGARRAKFIIGDLQSLTTSQRGVEQVDLARAVNQTLALLKPRTGPGVRIDTQLDPVAPVTARAGQLEQVLVNLVDNALRAVGPNGHLLVKLEAAETRFRLIVKDDGPGMTAEVKKQALEPFFTTRAPGEGSGMGLAIVAAIVSGHQGTVTLNSEPGAGTEIVIDLPLRPELPSREVAAVKRAGSRDEDRF
jgi:signal transduction histidine kinase